MITCLVDYIGLQGISGEPTSGRYINEMPGIDTDRFDLIRDSEWYDTEAAWDALENRTIKKFESKINQWAVKYYSDRSISQTFVTAQYDNKTTIPTSDNYAGILFNNPYTYVQNVSILIQAVELYADSNVETTIRIFNASTGDLIFSKQAALTGGTINSVIIGQEFPIWKYPHLFICYDENDVDTIRATKGLVGEYINTQQKRISTASDIIVSNMETTGNTGQGLILKYNLACTLDNFICNRLSLFEESYMNLLCAEFCQEVVYSDRVSRFTLLDRDAAIALRDEYLEEFESSLNHALDNVSIARTNDYCFECEKLINHKTLLP